MTRRTLARSGERRSGHAAGIPTSNAGSDRHSSRTQAREAVVRNDRENRREGRLQAFGLRCVPARRLAGTCCRIQAGWPAGTDLVNAGALRETLANALLLGEGIAYDLTACSRRYLDVSNECSPTDPMAARWLERPAWWLAATNRWLTAADACVARYPTKLAFCSRFRRQRETPVATSATI
jgi:hypothetical protein